VGSNLALHEKVQLFHSATVKAEEGLSWCLEILRNARIRHPSDSDLHGRAFLNARESGSKLLLLRHTVGGRELINMLMSAKYQP
jgi:hypothetical protein